MPDHDYYEELTALSAGGHLSRQEQDELQDHLSVCQQCQRSVRVYADIVSSGLPVTHGVADAGARATAEPDPRARERFLARARREGARFSPEVDSPASARWPLGYRLAAGLAFAATVIVALYIPDFSRRLIPGSDAQPELARLTRENAALAERVATGERELADRLEQLQKLQSQLAASVRVGDTRRSDQPGFQLGQSTSLQARLLDEIQNRDQQLAAAVEEIGRINQLRVADHATLDAQAARLRGAFDQLRIANATIEMERQLVAAGRDLLQLVLAKQLRVVDVRDTDANGRPSQAFARVFIADGTTIRIFAFDLNENAGAGPRRYQVWGEQLGNSTSVRSLGVLDVDDRIQNRWSLTVQNADAVKDINSVFVTISGRGNAPDGPRLLYAFLG